MRAFWHSESSAEPVVGGTMSRKTAAFMFAIACWIFPSTVLADDPPEVFFISMRSPDVEPVPRFVSVYEDQTQTVTEPIAGCDGNTYYATFDDASVITAALANGNSIELVTGSAGTAPQDAGVICIIQNAF
jgi:hypothetical protein